MILGDCDSVSDGDCDSVRDGRYVGGVEGEILGGRVDDSVVVGACEGDCDGDVKDDEFVFMNVVGCAVGSCNDAFVGPEGFETIAVG